MLNPSHEGDKVSDSEQAGGMFDPIGAGPAVHVKSKIAMQELWQLGLGRDEEVSPEVKWK